MGAIGRGWTRLALSATVISFAPAAHAGFVPRAGEGPASINVGGGTFVDLDGDGHVDFLGEAAETWLGQGDGTFVAGSSCDPAGSPAVADFDNDGDLDILRVRDVASMCRQQDDGSFESSEDWIDPNPYAGANPERDVAYAAAAADLDGDGWIDLYLTNYESPNLVGFPDAIYANDGTGRLELVGETPEGKALPSRGVTIADYDNDGDPDIYVSNYRLAPNFLWENNGAGGIAEVGQVRGVQGTPFFAHTISSAFGDLDGDGEIDLLVGNFAHPGQPEIEVLINDMAASEAFVNVGAGHGITWQESYAGVALADYDNDGDLDLFVTTVYEGDFGRLYQNQGDASFVDVTVAEGLAGQERGYSVTWADVDEDGTLDLYLGGQQENHLYLGEPNGNHWLRVKLRGDGEVVNGAAIGARVTVRAGDRTHVREVQSGGTGADRGASDQAVHVGLGDHAGTVELEVRWPWAETCVFEVEVDAVIALDYDPADPACATSGTTGTGSDTGDGDTGDATGAETSNADSSGDAGQTDGDSSGCGCTVQSRTSLEVALCLLVLIGTTRRRP